jgi:hypothetical protein
MKINDRFITNNANFAKGRQGVLFLCPHTYNGAGADLYNWFQTNTNQVSAHYAVDMDGNIYQYVSDNDTAYAMGNSWANPRSISVEFADNGNPGDSARTDALYKAGAWLFNELRSRHFGDRALDRDLVQLHSQHASTGCPGALDYNRIIREANALMGDSEEVAIWKKQRPDVWDAYKDVEKIKNEWFPVRGEIELWDGLWRHNRNDVKDAWKWGKIDLYEWYVNFGYKEHQAPTIWQ